jgi:hypothetical protein
MGEWELGLSPPPLSGASRWSAMGAQLEVQPQIKLTLTQTGLLIEDAEKINVYWCFSEAVGK